MSWQDFECNVVPLFFERTLRLTLKRKYPLTIGVSTKKRHQFDAGCDDPPTLIECKCCSWRKNQKTRKLVVPAAKIAHLNEALLFFMLAPRHYQCILAVSREIRPSDGKSLGDYYLSRYRYLIPENVEVWEIEGETGRRIHPA